MKRKEFKEKVFKQAEKKGLKDYELYFATSREFEVSINNGMIQNYKDAEKGGVSFKAVKDARAGYSYTEDFTGEEAKRLVKDATENLELISVADSEDIYRVKTTFENWKDYDEAFEEIAASEKIEKTKQLEKMILDKDKRIINVPYCYSVNHKNEIFFANSAGCEYTFKTGGGGMYGGAVATNGKQNKFGLDFLFSTDPGKIDTEELAEKIGQKALRMLDSKSIKSGKYPTILNHEVVGSLLGLFVQMISAENVQKGFSLLKGKLGKEIISEKLSILDDPAYPDSIHNVPADAQGVATAKKRIVQHGSLKTYLHSIKTAKKDGTDPTGNAFRGSYKGTETINPVNIVIKKGDLSMEDLMQKMSDGVLITEVQGMHAGANAVSGEFSLSAAGFRIENGKRAYPIEQITLNGNLLSMLGDVMEVGADRQQAMTFSYGTFVPSLYIKEMDIAGSD